VLMFSPSVLEALLSSGAQYLMSREPQYQPLAEFVQRNLLIGNMSAGNTLLGFVRNNWSAATHALVVSAVYALIFLVPTLISFSRRDVS